MKFEKNKLVEISVFGEINSALWPTSRQYRVGEDGTLRVVPGTGGICYSHQIGDNAIDLYGDHVEPGVTIRAPKANDNAALNTLTCIGNKATVVSGAAQGDAGIVTGKHGGVDHVMIDFPQRTLNKLVIGDRIQIRAYGTGLELTDAFDVAAMNCSPELLKKWGIKSAKGKLHVPVTHLVPAAIMGSGLGAVTCHSGDYDIQMFDEKTVEEYNLNSLRFGDLVAIIDADHSYGRSYLSGAVSIGVIVHSKSDMSGHGPGVTTLLSSRSGAIAPKISRTANIGHLFKIGRWRNKTKKS